MISDSNSEGNHDSYYHSFSSNEKEVIYKAILSRRDVRSHFVSGRVIPNDVLLRILDAASSRTISRFFTALELYFN